MCLVFTDDCAFKLNLVNPQCNVLVAEEEIMIYDTCKRTINYYFFFNQTNLISSLSIISLSSRAVECDCHTRVRTTVTLISH